MGLEETFVSRKDADTYYATCQQLLGHFLISEAYAGEKVCGVEVSKNN